MRSYLIEEDTDMTLEGMKRKVAREISIEGKLKALVEFGASDLLTLPTVLTIEQLPSSIR